MRYSPSPLQYTSDILITESTFLIQLGNLDLISQCIQQPRLSKVPYGSLTTRMSV